MKLDPKTLSVVLDLRQKNGLVATEAAIYADLAKSRAIWTTKETRKYRRAGASPIWIDRMYLSTYGRCPASGEIYQEGGLVPRASQSESNSPSIGLGKTNKDSSVTPQTVSPAPGSFHSTGWSRMRVEKLPTSSLISCPDCGRSISIRAAVCPGCGAPVNEAVNPAVTAVPPAPIKVSYNRSTEMFGGTMVLMTKLAMRAIQELGWKLDQVNEAVGLVTFQTGISWGSWSGVSGSLNIEEVALNTFTVTGSGKQNLSGSQLIALDLGGEAQGKARKVIEKMKQLTF